jgi:hypothetical protein
VNVSVWCVYFSTFPTQRSDNLTERDFVSPVPAGGNRHRTWPRAGNVSNFAWKIVAKVFFYIYIFCRRNLNLIAAISRTSIHYSTVRHSISVHLKKRSFPLDVIHWAMKLHIFVPLSQFYFKISLLYENAEKIIICKERENVQILCCHMLVIRHGVWIDNWIYSTHITHNSNTIANLHA